MKILTDPQLSLIECLEEHKTGITLESDTGSSFISSLRSAMPDIINYFSSDKTVAELPTITYLNKDQKSFVKLISDYTYAEIAPLRAYSPEGMNTTYLNYLNQLLPIIGLVKGIQNNVLQPYCLFLAHLVSDKKASVSTDDNHILYKKLEENRELAYSCLSKLYTKNSFKSETIIGKVIDRNADWVLVFDKLNSCINEINSVNRVTLSSMINQCEGYLQIIYDDLKKNEDIKTSKETATRLANGAYQVAKEVEFFSNLYYRVLAISGCIDNTVIKIKSIIK